MRTEKKNNEMGMSDIFEKPATDTPMRTNRTRRGLGAGGGGHSNLCSPQSVNTVEKIIWGKHSIVEQTWTRLKDGRRLIVIATRLWTRNSRANTQNKKTDRSDLRKPRWNYALKSALCRYFQRRLTTKYEILIKPELWEWCTGICVELGQKCLIKV